MPRRRTHARARWQPKPFDLAFEFGEPAPAPAAVQGGDPIPAEIPLMLIAVSFALVGIATMFAGVFA